MGSGFLGGRAPFGNHTCVARWTWWRILLEVEAILLVTRNCQYFPRLIWLSSFVFQVYENYGVTMSGVLKRKYEELGDDSTYCSSSSCSPLSSSASSGWESDEESSRGEPKPSSALTPSFTREYLRQPLSGDQTCPCTGVFVAWLWVHAETPLEHAFGGRSGRNTSTLSLHQFILFL